MNHIKTPQKKQSIGILGLGSIGCLIASQLPSRYNLFALTRKAIESFNFSIQQDNSESQYLLPSWNGEVLDLIIICCKASQTLEAIKQWQTAISSETQIVLLQNGYGQHNQIAKLFPHNSLFAASTTEGANRITPNIVKHAGIGITQWGHFAGPITKLKIQLEELSGKHQFNDEINQTLIEKLAINCVINPLTVKFNCPNGTLIENPIAFIEFQKLCCEIEYFFKAMNWKLRFNLLDRASQVASLTANNISSMLQDYRNHQQSEIDYINGYLVNAAQDNKISLPINEALVKEIRILGLH